MNRLLVSRGMPRSLLLVLASLILSCTLAACGPASAPPRLTLRMAIHGPIYVPDPARVATPAEQFVASLLFSGLMKFSSDLHVIPELAVSIPTISSNGRTYTFTIRQDARFADGSRCTAHAVAASLARALAPAEHSLLARRALGNIAGAIGVERGTTSILRGVSILGRWTLRIRLTRPDASFLQKLALPVASVVQPGASSLWTAGTGAWAPARRDRNGSLLLTPRHHFYGGAMALRSLVLVPAASATRSLDLYMKGAVDVAAVPFDRWAQEEHRQDFYKSASLNSIFAVAPPSVGALLASHINRDLLVSEASQALSPAGGLVPSATPDYLPPPAQNFSVGGSPPAVHIVVASKTPAARAAADALRRQWRTSAAGPRVWVLQDWRALPDPGVWLRIARRWTASRWYSAQLRHANALTNDPVGRMNVYSGAEEWLIARATVLPLASQSIGFLIRSRVQNLQVTPAGVMPLNNNWAGVSVS